MFLDRSHIQTYVDHLHKKRAKVIYIKVHAVEKVVLLNMLQVVLLVSALGGSKHQ